MSSLLLIECIVSVSVYSDSLGYGCFMDGCNPQRDFSLGAAYVPYLYKQSLRLNWTFNTNVTNDTLIDTTNINTDQYLGCTTNTENGISNAVTCLFKQGLFTIDQNGALKWSYADPIVSSVVPNISSVPLLLPIDTTIIDTGTHIMAFNNGVFDWQELVSNLSIPSNTVSKFSVGFVDPQYFSITLGDGRFSVYDYSEGMCWASVVLTHKEQSYTPIAVTSSIDKFVYVIGRANDDAFGRNKCGIFALEIGDASYRLQTRWVYEYSCKKQIGYLGMSVVQSLNASNDSVFPVGTIIVYSLDNITNGTGISAVGDLSEHRSEHLWTMTVNQYCGMGYLVDPRDMDYGMNGVWICDYYANDTLLLKQVNISDGRMISEMNVNSVLFDTFSVNDNWKSVLSVNISSRGVSGLSADMEHYVIVVCVNVVFNNEDNDVTDANLLTVLDIESQYLLSWYMFETENKCVGQLSATTDGRIIIPLSDGMSVVAISV